MDVIMTYCCVVKPCNLQGNHPLLVFRIEHHTDLLNLVIVLHVNFRWQLQWFLRNHTVQESMQQICKHPAKHNNWNKEKKSSFHQQFMVSIFIIAELADIQVEQKSWNRFCPGGDFNPGWRRFKPLGDGDLNPRVTETSTPRWRGFKPPASLLTVVQANHKTVMRPKPIGNEICYAFGIV